ncbi:MAG: hypothetical protein HZA93_29665 [Verrucomicrobia bacterium]|nr:hypothetical protein [Verrucomicrobiota bacterium]
MKLPLTLAALLALASSVAAADASPPFQISGVYPHLAMFNGGNECGTGAVVPWADRLWVVTYSPHSPKGSDDKLYEITSDLRQIIRPESIGGTPANRFIHTESQQLFIGPYAIDAQRRVRAISYDQMFGRPTGNARHLTDPANKIYYASMEEGFYEVDVRSLAVTELFRDEQVKDGRKADLPGYHGKGLYSGQGVLIYANNGEQSALARQKPDIPSGALAEWDGRAEKWTVVRRNQFTEVTGPGDLSGNPNPATDPLWTIGWDHRSLILMVRDTKTVGGALRPDSPWHSYRLPKASHSYDGAHGWNTEWPRIRDIGETDLLMTMHGAFWRFPKDFAPAKSSGIAPRSNYLKVVGDFTRWGDRLVLGCDDTAKSEFLNKRRVKGTIAGPGQSQSNLWFVDPAQLDRLGPCLGRGAVWLDEPVKKDAPSDPFLFSGFEQRLLHLAHDAGASVTFTLEIDRAGEGRWTTLRTIDVPAAGYTWIAFESGTGLPTRDSATGRETRATKDTGAWIRIRASRDLAHATAFFSYRNRDPRPTTPDARFAGLVSHQSSSSYPSSTAGLLHARGAEKKTLGLATSGGYYEMGPDLRLRRLDDAAALAWARKNFAIPTNVIGADAASIIYTDEQGKRWRLPRGRADFAATGPFGDERIAREVVTERDVLNCGGTFFELPAENAGGIAKVRPIATHNRRIQDFASWRGLMVLTGVEMELWEGLYAPTALAGRQTNRGVKPLPQNPHIIRSTDGRAAVWLGAIDDLWAFGKATGVGGPWKDTAVTAGAPSEPYLLTGYDRKKLTLSHTAAAPVRMKLEVDLTGTGVWATYATLDVPAGRPLEHAFPDGYQAYWLRVTADTATTATAWLTYD